LVKEISLTTVANKPGYRGAREISRKTIARGMPDVSGVTMVTNACAFYHCARGCGRAERPAFPAPSDLQKAGFLTKNSGASRGENAGVYAELEQRHCERSEAIHQATKQEWIASSLRSSQ